MDEFSRIKRLPPYIFGIIGDLKQQARRTRNNDTFNLRYSSSVNLPDSFHSQGNGIWRFIHSESNPNRSIPYRQKFKIKSRHLYRYIHLYSQHLLPKWITLDGRPIDKPLILAE